MKTRVVNIRHGDTYDVYIGRPGHGLAGPFGNPVKIDTPCPECDEIHEDGGSTLACYEKYLLRRVRIDVGFRKAVLQLRGKVLGCFCKPKNCHGDVLARYVDSLPESP